MSFAGGIVNKIQATVASRRASPHELPLKLGTDDFSRDFPAWHFSMVNDHKRNSVIEKAIAAMNSAGKTVVEIGTGTGLIALLFARYGAARVVSCELNKNLADIAREIIAQTPFHSKIEVIHASSTMAIQRGLLPRNPDIIFTETLDCGVVGEGFFSIARDIEKLAAPHTQIMPMKVRQRAIVIDSSAIADLNRSGVACGFDLQALNRFSTKNYFPIHAELHKHRCLTEAQVVREFTYINCAEAELVPVVTLENGRAHGLLSWFEANFGGAMTNNEPFSGSHWHQAFHPVQNELRVRAGQELDIRIDDDGFASILLS